MVLSNGLDELTHRGADTVWDKRLLFFHYDQYPLLLLVMEKAKGSDVSPSSPPSLFSGEQRVGCTGVERLCVRFYAGLTPTYHVSHTLPIL